MLKLEKYLADYIRHEQTMSITGDVAHKLQEIIKQGLDAFESTEQIKCYKCDGYGRTSCNEAAERDMCKKCKGTGKLSIIILETEK